MYDIIIVGAGPSGMTAAIYAARSEKSVLVLEKANIGGQMAFSNKIENFPSRKEIGGNELSAEIFEQAKALGVEFKTRTVLEIVNETNEKRVITDEEVFTAKCVILAVGTVHRKLGAENEEDSVGKGVSYCAVCDGPFFKNKKVCVIGGGNTAVSTALMLSDICSCVTVIQDLPYLTAEKKAIRQLEERKNVGFVFSADVKSFNQNNGRLCSIGVCVGENRKEMQIDSEGAFICIGEVAQNGSFSSVLTLDENGYIICDENMKTSADGIFACGDCIRKKVRQITTAISDGTVAALSACEYIKDL